MTYQEALNAYRIMWLFVFFDLPTETKEERKQHAKFRQDLLKEGFIMFQFSIYIRHCNSRENAAVHLKRVKQLLPDKGSIGILGITDKQFETIELYYGKKIAAIPDANDQLELF
jgi:CRISPR-associated protein Cas2